MEKSIVSQIINRRINEIRVMSFFIGSQPVCDVVAMFLMIGNDWYKVTISDGVSSVEKQENSPEILELNQIQDEFAYPIRVHNAENFQGIITDIKEYLWEGQLDESIGLYFILDNENSFSLIESNECITVIHGIHDLNNHFILKSF